MMQDLGLYRQSTIPFTEVHSVLSHIFTFSTIPCSWNELANSMSEQSDACWPLSLW